MMTNLIAELNQLTQEILEMQPNIKSTQESLKTPNAPKTRGERIHIGFNFLKYNQLLYSLQRFSKLVETKDLSEDCQKLLKTEDSINKAIEFIQNPSEDLKKYLDN